MRSLSPCLRYALLGALLTSSSSAYAAIGYNPIVFVFAFAGMGLTAALTLAFLYLGYRALSKGRALSAGWTTLYFGLAGASLFFDLFFIYAEASPHPMLYLEMGLKLVGGAALLLFTEAPLNFSPLPPGKRRALKYWPLGLSLLLLALYFAVSRINPAGETGLAWLDLFISFSIWHVILFATAQSLLKNTLTYASAIALGTLGLLSIEHAAVLEGAPGWVTLASVVTEPLSDSIKSSGKSQIGKGLCGSTLLDDPSWYKAETDITGILPEEGGGIVLFGRFTREHTGGVPPDEFYKVLRLTPAGGVDKSYALNRNCLEENPQTEKRPGDLLIPDLEGMVRLHADGTFARAEEVPPKRLLHSSSATQPDGALLEIKSSTVTRTTAQGRKDAAFGTRFREAIDRLKDHTVIVNIQTFNKSGDFLVLAQGNDSKQFLKFRADGTRESKFAYDNRYSYFRGPLVLDILPNDQILRYEDAKLYKMNPDGKFDDQFSQNLEARLGQNWEKILTAYTVGRDGKIYGVVNSDQKITVERFDFDGKLDAILVK